MAWSQWTCALLELLHGGDLHAAMSWTQQALEMAWKMGDTWLPAWGLWLEGCIAAELGMAERAAYLFGGTLQRQRRTRVMVAGLRPWWQVQQRAQKIARSALGEDEFQAQLARGASAPSEDVMDVALQPVPRPSTDQDPAEAAAPAPIQGLSPREHQVAELVAQEWRNREIAQQLGISIRTVEVYVASLIRKLEAGSRVGVAVRFAALRQQSLPPAEA